MNSLDIKKIESIIQYEFKNKKLLEEAFLIEAIPDNNKYSSEVFRIPGKRAINFALNYIVLHEYGQLDDDGYSLKTSKDDVNYILDNLYTREIFTRNIIMLGLAEYLNIPDDDSFDDMTRRLFESLVGAVTIDSNWNMATIKQVVSFLLDSDFYLVHGFENYDEHYVAKIYNWCAENNKTFPMYQFVDNECHVKFGKEVIIGKGKSKTLAKFDAARQVYEALKARGFIQERDSEGYLIGKPNILLEDAVDYLKNQYEAGNLGEINYTFAKDGEATVCICQVEDVDYTFDATDMDERKAQRMAAYKMICYLLGYRVDND